MRAFDHLMTATDPAMAVVTVAAAGERDGCLVGFSTQCSIDPARVLVCLSVRNRTYRLARSAATLAVHYPGEDARDLAVLFGGETGDETDKLARVNWSPWTDGTPLLEDCPDRLVGEVTGWLDGGDHAVVLLEVVHAEGVGPTRPLRLSQMLDVEPGHQP